MKMILDRISKVSLEIVLSLVLINMLILSATLYYKAVKFQRFMEPIIALSRPKVNFTNNIDNLLIKEFGTSNINGLKFTSDSIIIDGALFDTFEHEGEIFGPIALLKLGKLFLSILKDPKIAPYIDIVLVNKKIPLNAKDKKRLHLLQDVEAILDTLFRITPELEKDFGRYFATAIMPGHMHGRNKQHNIIEFRFIATERLHIDIIRELGKYLT